MSINLKERTDCIDVEIYNIQQRIDLFLRKYNCSEINQVLKSRRYKLVVLKKYIEIINTYKSKLICYPTLELNIKNMIKVEDYENAEAYKLALNFFIKNKF